MPFPRDIAAALADDAETLAMIHDRELAAAFVEVLRSIRFPGNLVLLPVTASAREAWQIMQTALDELPAQIDSQDLDALAADFAAIYLTAAYGASPCESAWTDEDHLLCQDSMFQLRAIYSASGLAAKDWRRRPDDHLVLQLAYLAHAMRRASHPDHWRELAKVMDEHLLRWLPDFCRRIAACCATPLYAGLALVTHEWADGLRNLLAERLAEPRPTREEIELRLRPQQTSCPVPQAFVPGVGPTI
jgi:TorA maturation chaperone TorD